MRNTTKQKIFKDIKAKGCTIKYIAGKSYKIMYKSHCVDYLIIQNAENNTLYSEFKRTFITMNTLSKCIDEAKLFDKTFDYMQQAKEANSVQQKIEILENADITKYSHLEDYEYLSKEIERLLNQAYNSKFIQSL